jgi:hypothetical protein
MSAPEMSSVHGRGVVAAPHHRVSPAVAEPKADLLDECVQRIAAGDTIALQTLYDRLSLYVRDSAACLFGYGNAADNITDAVFIDVWHLAGQYRPGHDERVCTWVLNIAGQHTMNRYHSNTGSAPGADNINRWSP